MNKDILRGQWLEMKGKVKQHWGKLTDDEITRIEGKEDELVGLLQKRYGYTKDHAHKEVDKFMDQQK